MEYQYDGFRDSVAKESEIGVEHLETVFDPGSEELEAGKLRTAYVCTVTIFGWCKVGSEAAWKLKAVLREIAERDVQQAAQLLRAIWPWLMRCTMNQSCIPKGNVHPPQGLECEQRGITTRAAFECHLSGGGSLWLVGA